MTAGRGQTADRSPRAAANASTGRASDQKVLSPPSTCQRASRARAHSPRASRASVTPRPLSAGAERTEILVARRELARGAIRRNTLSQHRGSKKRRFPALNRHGSTGARLRDATFATNTPSCHAHLRAQRRVPRTPRPRPLLAPRSIEPGRLSHGRELHDERAVRVARGRVRVDARGIVLPLDVRRRRGGREKIALYDLAGALASPAPDDASRASVSLLAAALPSPAARPARRASPRVARRVARVTPDPKTSRARPRALRFENQTIPSLRLARFAPRVASRRSLDRDIDRDRCENLID